MKKTRIFFIVFLSIIMLYIISMGIINDGLSKRENFLLVFVLLSILIDNLFLRRKKQ